MGLKVLVGRLERGLDGVPAIRMEAGSGAVAGAGAENCWTGSGRGKMSDGFAGWGCHKSWMGKNYGAGTGRGEAIFRNEASCWRGAGAGLSEICDNNVGRGLERSGPVQRHIQVSPCSELTSSCPNPLLQ